MIDLSDKKIAVLKGGPGSEREVSLKTAESVSYALATLGAQVIDVEVGGATVFVLNVERFEHL